MGFLDKLKAERMKEDAKEKRIAEKLAEKERIKEEALNKNIQLFQQSGIEGKFREYVEQVNCCLRGFGNIEIEEHRRFSYGFELKGVSKIDFEADHKGLFTTFYHYIRIREGFFEGERYSYHTDPDRIPLRLERVNEKYMERCVKWVRGESIFVPKSWW